MADPSDHVTCGDALACGDANAAWHQMGVEGDDVCGLDDHVIPGEAPGVDRLLA
jgi:hypothetical protein